MATTYKLSPVWMICVTATSEKFSAVMVTTARGSVHRVFLWCHGVSAHDTFEASPEMLLPLAGDSLRFCERVDARADAVCQI